MYNNEYNYVDFTYADDICLLCHTISGIQKEMLRICEENAFNYKITFNATKTQLLYLSYLDKDHSDLLNLTMKDGNVIPYVSKCVHLGTTLYTQLYRDNVIDVVNELYKCTNHLLSDFSFTESCTVSNLFNSYFNLYNCQMWRFNKKKHFKAIHVVWRKCIRRIWKINSKTHNDLLHHNIISNYLPMDILLEKRCIKFIYNIINSEHSLHSRIAPYSLYMIGDKEITELRKNKYKYLYNSVLDD